jgi:hypothetical protein
LKPALDQRKKCLEFVGGVHLFPHGILDEADFRGVRVRVDQVARNDGVGLIAPSSASDFSARNRSARRATWGH